jgi:hypothetical protein
MHIIIDMLAAIILLFFLLAGWHKGFLLSLLGVVRVIVAYGISYLAGRYLGFWLGEVTHRPRLVTIPVVAVFTFVVITFIFHIIMYEIREHKEHKEKKEDFQLPIYSCVGGAAISLIAGALSLVLLFWLGNLFLVGISGQPIPGAEKAHFGRFARRTVYECANFAGARKSNPSQAATIARMISNPAEGMQHLGNVLAADSVQQILTDKQFAEDLISGDPERIEQNASLQQFFNDRATLDELQKLGVLSGDEKKSVLCEKLSRFGSNETIQSSLESLKAKQLLSTDKIKILVRDPDFDAIIAELLK